MILGGLRRRTLFGMGEESRLRRPSTTREIVEGPLDVEPPMTVERAEALSIADSFPSPMGQK